ncbi:MAG: 2OG-Fe(II) oxygenase [Gammaproteobacteria bacterium]
MTSATLEQRMATRVAELDTERLRAQFAAQNEFIALENFLPHDWLDAVRGALPTLEPHVHRNYIPRHKKGGSISRFDLDRLAPQFGDLYRSEAFRDFLGRLIGCPLLLCPGNDPHTYALYYYTEAGDHIGYHYDTSYYNGARYTILVGLVDESNCLLEYQLFKGDAQRERPVEGMHLSPGALVVFNGDKLWHRVTPLGENERRIALTLEYVTSASMNPVRRFVSNMKDAIAYFGFRQVFRSWNR